VLTAVDTNVISALWSRAPLAAQALDLMTAARLEGQLVICGLVYSELVANPGATPEFVDGFLTKARIEVDFRIDRRLCREAGIRFQAHARRRQKAHSGIPRRIVADFLIGMHALMYTDRLLTFDRDGYKQDFPELIMAPDRIN
jgi:predicted nucleic acid-binding protein